MEDAREFTLHDCLHEVAAALQVGVETLQDYYADLKGSSSFLDAFNESIDGVPEFQGTFFRSVNDFRAYRCLLYVVTRCVKPQVFVETGVLGGFSSAFILLAMDHNNKGTLHSIDLPPTDLGSWRRGRRHSPQGRNLAGRYRRDCVVAMSSSSVVLRLCCRNWRSG